MAMQSHIPRLQTATASPPPSTRSTPSPELKVTPKSKIPSRPETPSTQSTPSPELKSAPKSKIPSRPQTPSSDLQTRLGWRPSGHWKPPGIAPDAQSPSPGHGSLAPDTPSSANTSRLPRIIPWLTRKGLTNQTSSPKVSSPSSSSKNSTISSEGIGKGSSSKRDWRTTWWGDSGTPLLDLMRQQNPNVDRSPAIVGEPDDSKRFVKLLNPYSRPIGPDSQDPIAQMVYPKKVDWFERDDVSALNKWRKATFDYYLGPAHEREVEWHPLQDDFVVREYSQLQKEAREMQGIVRVGKDFPSWAKITRDFNRRFEGRRLEGADLRLRSKVTREMLRKRYIELASCGTIFTGGDRSTEGEAFSDR